MRQSLSVVALFLSLAGFGAFPAFAENTDLEERLQNLLASFANNYRFPGATVAFVLPNGSVGGTAIGMADTEAGKVMTSETRMLAASIGKTFVSSLILSLENEGTLSQADHISRHLGGKTWFSHLPNASEITIRHLLSHTAGLPDHVHMDAFAKKIIERGNKGSFKPEDAIALILDKPPLFKAGSGWSYSDSGYLLLGLVIEAATGCNFYELVKKRFLTPLRLNNTSPSITPTLAGLAVGYTIKDNPFGLPARTMDNSGSLLWNPAIEWTGGGFISTSRDLARWGHALFLGAALKDPYLDRLLDGIPIHPASSGILYGNGVGIHSKTEFGPVYGHGGWIPGYVSSLRHYADHDITIAFQINSDVGVVDHSSDLVKTLEVALAKLLIKTYRNK